MRKSVSSTPLAWLLLTSWLVCAPATAETSEEHWAPLPQSDLVYLKTQHGDVIIALTSAIAPNHVERFKNLVQRRFYDNRYFYRVIEGFVAQGGTNDTHEASDFTRPLQAEFSAPSVDGFYEVERPGLFAPVSGFINGFAAGTDQQRSRYWLLHCPGAVAMARDNDADSGATEFYVVLGQAPRHLDRNMSVFGRVVAGMAALQALPRGESGNGGVIADYSPESELVYARLGSDLPANEQRHFAIQLPSDPDYQQRLSVARDLDNPFFTDKALAPRPIDVCYYQTEVREIAPDAPAQTD